MQSEAYCAGWHSGRFDPRPATEIKLPECPLERLDFWRGHRAGRSVRNMLRVGVAS